MGYAFLAIATGAVLFTFAFRFVVHSAGKGFGRAIYAAHKSAEEMLATNAPPAHWCDEARSRGFSGDGRGRRYLMRRLARLIRYFRRAPVFETEEIRMDLLNQLETLRSGWSERTMDELCPPASENGNRASPVCER